MSYYSKSGALLWGPISLVDWWQAQGGVDPKVLYDPASGRFYVVMSENLVCNPHVSYLRLAVSKTSDPQGPEDWWRFAPIDITEYVGGNVYAGDFPCIGSPASQ